VKPSQRVLTADEELMQEKRCTIGLLGILVAFALLTPRAASATTNPVIKAKLEDNIEIVRTEKPSMARTSAAQNLAELTKGIDPSSVDDATVADMVSLLDVPDDSVGAWVAASLGHLGRRAKMAVPKLLALLPEVDCLQGDLTSAATIRPALKRMGVKPPPVNLEECKSPQN
jgi:hypothetical protein